jgi:hypothetical protein
MIAYFFEATERKLSNQLKAIEMLFSVEINLKIKASNGEE